MCCFSVLKWFLLFCCLVYPLNNDRDKKDDWLARNDWSNNATRKTTHCHITLGRFWALCSEFVKIWRNKRESEEGWRGAELHGGPAGRSVCVSGFVRGCRRGNNHFQQPFVSVFFSPPLSSCLRFLILASSSRSISFSSFNPHRRSMLCCVALLSPGF